MDGSNGTTTFAQTKTARRGMGTGELGIAVIRQTDKGNPCHIANRHCCIVPMAVAGQMTFNNSLFSKKVEIEYSIDPFLASYVNE